MALDDGGDLNYRRQDMLILTGPDKLIPVPENSSTVALLGFALLAVEGTRRKLRS